MKFNYFEHGLLKSLLRRNQKGLVMNVRTMGRGSTITSDMIGRTISIHNGFRYFPLTVTYEMVGMRLGDFIFTKSRSGFIHVNNRIEVKKSRIKKASGSKRGGKGKSKPKLKKSPNKKK